MTATTLLAFSMLFPFLPQEPQKPVSTNPPAKATIERKGTVVPADPVEVQLWLDSYRDELLVLDVVPHGMPVNEGDVLVRLDTRKIDEQIQQAEFALQQQVERAKIAEQEQQLQDQAAEAELQRVQRDADWSARRLEGFLGPEKQHRDEQERMTVQAEDSQLEDQTDELTQLEKMYKEDELVDATEEIVLKRSRRGLARMQAGIALQRLIRQYTHELAQVIEKESRQAEVAQKQAALERQQRAMALKQQTKKLDADKQKLELERAQQALDRLQRDREAMQLRAPKSGIVLHGEPDQAPGSGKLEKGSMLSQRKTFLCIAAPGHFEVRTDLLEDDVASVKLGAAAEVVPAGRDDLKQMGSARIANLPTGRDGEGRNLYEVRVALPKADPRLCAGMRCKVQIHRDTEAK